MAASAFYLELGRRAKERRTELGLTQDEVAEALQLGRSSVANLERGEQRISAETLAILAATLATGVSELTPPASPQSDLVARIEKEAPESVRRVLRAALAQLA